MTDQEWKWWVGHDGKHYHTECATREEAVHIASHEQDGGYIVEATKVSNITVSRYFDATDFIEDTIERAHCDFGDHEGDGEVFSRTSEQDADLQAMVRAAVDAWQQKHDLIFKPFQFARWRNEEYIPARSAAHPMTTALLVSGLCIVAALFVALIMIGFDQ